jgi:PAS domain S-box-containing protein
MYRKDGSIVPVEISISLLLDPEERPVGIIGVSRDISDRTEAERAVAKSEARYRMFAENVDDIIFTLTPELELDYVSPSLIKLTGYTFEELVEMGWQGLFTPDSLEMALETISDDVLGAIEPEKAREKSVIMELEILTKQGKNRWIEVNVSLMFTDTGDVTGMLGVARDVTERKRAQTEFIEEKKRAELYLDLFGHDIRNINQGIMSYLELILMRQGLNPDEAEYIKSVLEQATRINDLVAKVQRLTQIRVKEIEPENVDAQKMISGALDYVIAKYPDRTVEVKTHEGCSIHVVRGSNLLMDVFTSILDNAIRFNRNDTVEVDISCLLTDDGKHLRFMFDDRGPGIPDEMKVKVFRRLDQPEGGARGSGLGLTVVGEIVKQVGGKVWVEDRVPGETKEGSRFVVELPVGEDIVD